MIKLLNGNSDVCKIIFKNDFSTEKQYRLSQYVLQTETDNKLRLFNTFTGIAVQLDNDEKERFLKLSKSEQTGAALSEAGFQQLAEESFFVKTSLDEYKQYQSCCQILSIMEKKEKGLKSYVIFPTTACNARCVYCFEEGYITHTMTNEIADKVVDYILQTKHNGCITLRWFGGEPLAASGIITRICQKLRDNQVDYRSSMTSNCSLMTKEMAREAKELWNLKSVQVSLDGARDDYEKRKKYLNPVRYNYDTVMRGIQYLLDEQIKVSIRCNYDKYNLAGIPEFAADLDKRFTDKNAFSIYMALLYSERDKSELSDTLKLENEAVKYFEQYGIRNSNYNISNNIKTHLNYCMADNLDKCVVIGPDGKFYPCEHLDESKSWGNVFEGVTNQKILDELHKKFDADEKCKKCVLLPHCTSFYRFGCPMWNENCLKFKSHIFKQMINSLDEPAES